MSSHETMKRASGGAAPPPALKRPREAAVEAATAAAGAAPPSAFKRPREAAAEAATVAAGVAGPFATLREIERFRHERAGYEVSKEWRYEEARAAAHESDVLLPLTIIDDQSLQAGADGAMRPPTEILWRWDGVAPARISFLPADLVALSSSAPSASRHLHTGRSSCDAAVAPAQRRRRLLRTRDALHRAA